MEYIYAAMLLFKAGKEITESNIKAVLTAAGVKADDARVKALVAALSGVDIAEAIKKAALAAPVAVAAPSSGAALASEKKDDHKQAAEESKKAEESAAAGLGALFG